MVIGEFEYDSGFSNNEDSKTDPPAFSYILFVLFIVIMTILLMNLLVRYEIWIFFKSIADCLLVQAVVGKTGSPKNSCSSV